MLKNSFYTIKQIVSEGNSHNVLVAINPQHSIFEGHFPEQPVVPGVCTLQIIKECACKVMGKELRYSTILSCKFSSMIIPSNNTIEISMVIKDSAIQASVLQDGNSMLKLKANFVEV